LDRALQGKMHIVATIAVVSISSNIAFTSPSMYPSSGKLDQRTLIKSDVSNK
jgi:hypothetical protein